ncbi:MAG: hypothetical protein IPH31_22775 [Lewinellaceae bacterium]|nr:hypothetical protein [Lewinellaceae bacterium]
MRAILYFAFLLAPVLSYSQKMLESHEWCSKSTSLAPPIFNLEDGRSDSIDILRSDITINLLGLPASQGAMQHYPDCQSAGRTGNPFGPARTYG